MDSDKKAWSKLRGYFGNLHYACRRIDRGKRPPSDGVFLSKAGKDLRDYLDGDMELTDVVNSECSLKSIYALTVLLSEEPEESDFRLENMSEDLGKSLDEFAEFAGDYAGIFYQLSGVAEDRRTGGESFDTEIVEVNFGRRVKANQS